MDDAYKMQEIATGDQPERCHIWYKHNIVLQDWEENVFYFFLINILLLEFEAQNAL